MNGHESLKQHSESGSQWDSLAELARGTKQSEEPIVESKAKALEYIRSLDLVSLTDDEIEEVMAHLRQYDKEIWSDDFIDDMQKIIIAQSNTDEKLPTYLLLNFGMPVETVLRNPEYYSEMIRERCADLPLGAIENFYHEMSATEEGRAQFQEDFVESGIMQDYTNRRVGEILYKRYDGASMAKTLSELKMAKKNGVKIIGHELFFFPDNFANGDEKKRKAVMAGRDLADLLYENGLFGEEEVADIYKQMLGPDYISSDAMNGMLEAALEKGIKISDEDARYWHQLFIKNGQNMIDVFDGEPPQTEEERARIRQEQFDFTAEPVMRLFASQESRWSSNILVGLYQSPQFRGGN